MASDREVAARFGLVVERGPVEACDDPALVHHVAALRHGADHVEILLDQDDSHAGLAVELDHVARDVLDDIRLDAFGGLIEQNEIGIGDQHPPERKLLLLAARHGAGALAPALRKNRKSVHDPLPSLLGDVALDGGADRDVLGHRQARKHVAPLRHVADAKARPLVSRQQLDSLATIDDRPAHRRNKPNQAFHQRRLATPLRPITATISPSRTSISRPWSTGLPPSPARTPSLAAMTSIRMGLPP